MSLSLSAERERLQRQVEELENILSVTHTELQLLSSDTDEEADEEDAERSAAGLLALREKVQKEIQNLETVLGTEDGSIWVSDDDGSSEESELSLSVDSCLQLNLIYQQVVQETLDQLETLLTQNHRQQNELEFQLSGTGKEPAREQPSSSSSYQQPISLYLGRFLKPYFKDKLTGLVWWERCSKNRCFCMYKCIPNLDGCLEPLEQGPPANQETKEKNSRMTGCLNNKKLRVKRWESWQKTLLIHSVSRDGLRRQIQPKLSRVDYLTQKLTSAKETDRQQLRGQIDTLEKEIDLLRAKKEEELIGGRYDEHDWQKISNIDFEGTRDADDIRRFWQNFLHPSVNKTRWSQQEVQQLKVISRRHGERHWETIAQELGTARTAFMCLQTFQRFVSDSLRRRTWTPAEDALLRELVDKMRIGNFIPYTQMSYFMKGRDPAQLIYRWNQVLDPSLKKGPWTKQEDQLLLEAVSRYGEKNWWKIRLEVPGRTDSACRDRYHDCLKAGTRRGGFDRRERELLLQLVDKHGVGHWAKIAAEIPHRNDAQCLRAWKQVSRLQPSQKHNTARQHLRRRNEGKTSSAKKSIKRRLIKVEEEEEESTEEDDEELVVQYMDSDGENDEKEIVELKMIKETEQKEEYTFPPMDQLIPAEKTENFTFLSFRPVVLPSPADAPTGRTDRSTVVGKFGRSVIIGPSPRLLQWEERHSTNRMMMMSPDQLRAYLHRRAHHVRNETQVTDLGLDYELQASVMPWIGNLLFPSKARLTTADVLRGRGEKAQLSSTLVFQLLLQAMNVDTAGCKKMIEQRRNKVVFMTPPPNPTSVQQKDPRTVAGMLQQRRATTEHSQILKQLPELPHQDKQKHQQLPLTQQTQPQQFLLMQPQPPPPHMSLSFAKEVIVRHVYTPPLSPHGPSAGRVSTSQIPASSSLYRLSDLSASTAPSSCSQLAATVPQDLKEGLPPHTGSILPPTSSQPCLAPWRKQVEAASIGQDGEQSRTQLEANVSKAKSRRKTLSCNRTQTQSMHQPLQLRPACIQSVALPTIYAGREVSTTQNLSSAPPPCLPDHDYSLVGPYPNPGLCDSDSRHLSPASKQIPSQLLPITPSHPPNYHLRERKRGSGEAGQSVDGVGKGKRIRRQSQKAKDCQETTKAQAPTKLKKTSSPCKKRPRKCQIQRPIQLVTPFPGLCLRPGQSMWIMTPGGLVQVAQVPTQALQLPLVPNGPFQLSPGRILAQRCVPLSSRGCRPLAPKPSIESVHETFPNHKSGICTFEIFPPTCVPQHVPYLVSSPIPSCPPEPNGVRMHSAEPTPSRRHLMQFSSFLMFLEPHVDVCGWLSGQGGVLVPGDGMALPYLPPFVSSLDVFSALLRTKRSLTKSSLQLLSQGSKPRHPQAKRKPDGKTEKMSSQPPPNLPDSTSGVGLHGDPPDFSISPDLSVEEAELVASVRQLVAERFSSNPAYQLLKARFLSCFTVPALMATVPPVTKKTLARRDNQQDEEECVEVLELRKSKERRRWRRSEVIGAEDEEQLFNDPALIIRRRKVGALLDILQRTGVKGYTAFLESLELDYPQLYSRITGKEPNKTFSILIDTAGESGLTQFLMSELSRLQRVLQDEKRRRQLACSVAKDQEAWSRQQQLRDRELRKLTERVQRFREERDRLSEEMKQLRDHNYSLMADINTLNQEKSNALLANRDLQIEVERLKNTVQRAESQTRLLRRRTARPPQEGRGMILPTDTFFHPDRLEEQKEEKPEEKRETEEDTKEEEKKEEDKKEQKKEKLKHSRNPQMNLLATVFKLRRELHKAEEQRTRSVEEKEELELCCAELKGDAKMYRQRNKQTLHQLEEVIRERDKTLVLQAEQQEEVRLLMHEKDQYREHVRKLTEQSDKLELLLLRSQGEVLQLRTRLRRITCNTHQCERSSEEEEESAEKATKGSSGTSGEKEEAATLQQHSSAPGDAEDCEEKSRTAASWEEPTDGCVTVGNRPHFFYRRQRALRSKFTGLDYTGCNLDDSSISDISDSD
ncbi:snRNA-activating protein complex subunit 4 isoform X2 [Betta splendens]|uniref:snRNA-activating protein complex subunit 4 isoform X2 n=1 Tax=Betta splendens TaxID=158456 RepID=A0A8M1HHH7_BETSP|nr:snRNA-activating protein complex subunit 4 isoform X2 [Betta splendens]